VQPRVDHGVAATFEDYPEMEGDAVSDVGGEGAEQGANKTFASSTEAMAEGSSFSARLQQQAEIEFEFTQGNIIW
jgi:hypothetical protein